MTVRAASDRSLLVSFGTAVSPEAHRLVVRLTRALQGERGILNLHPAYVSVLIDFDPRRQTLAEIEALVRERMESAARSAGTSPRGWWKSRSATAASTGPTWKTWRGTPIFRRERVVELHTAAEYEVSFVGFATCFPYLSGLPPALATPRLAAPRKHVPAGSVAIGGSQAGIYPLASPGGWRLIGRTPLSLFDPQGEPPALLRMGDRVRFVAAAEARLLNRLHILAPGMLTTVQDLGRFGWAHHGVSASGAADPLALRAGNLLVGNAENAAALEMTLVGAEIAFEEPAVIALTGSDFGAGLPLWSAVEIRAGQTVRCGATRSGARCYLCGARRHRGAEDHGQRVGSRDDRRGRKAAPQGRHAAGGKRGRPAAAACRPLPRALAAAPSTCAPRPGRRRSGLRANCSPGRTPSARNPTAWDCGCAGRPFPAPPAT